MFVLPLLAVLIFPQGLLAQQDKVAALKAEATPDAKAIEAAANHKAVLKATTPAELGDVLAFVRTLKK